MLNREIKALGNAALYVHFLNSDEKILVEETKQFWAASIIKIPIVITLYKQVASGKIKDISKKITPKKENVVKGSGIIHLLDQKNDYSIGDLAKLMIILSDNTAANEVIDLVGMDAINEEIKNNGLTNTVIKHKLEIAAGKGPNLTAAEDMGKLMEYLASAKESWAKEILNMMNEEKTRERILRYIPNDIEVPHKSGSLPEAVHDVGLIGAKNPYVFSFLSDDQADKKITAAKCGELAKICFDYAQK